MAFDDQTPGEPNPQISALAEVTIAAAAFLAKGFWEAAERVPEPEDFDDADLSALWAGILEARRRGPLSRQAVIRQLREMNFEEQRCFDALKRADVSFVSLAEGLEAAKILLDRRLRRQATLLCQETARALATAADVHATVQRHEKAVGELASHHDGGDEWTSGEDVQAETKERLPTGFDDVDRVSGGLPVGDLTILAGRPGMGKTAYAVSLAKNVAEQGHGVGFFSLEMIVIDLLMRGACASAYVPGDIFSGRTLNPYYDQAERGFLAGDMLQRYEAGMRHMRGLPIQWTDRRGLDIERIRLGARRLKAKMGRQGRDLKLLIIDHLGKIQGASKRDNRHQDLTIITDMLTVIAGELNVAVVALAQLNRQVEAREDKRPTLQDLRESGSIEENAHTVWLLYRPAYYDDHARELAEKSGKADTEKADAERARAEREKYHLEVDFAKNRGGERKRVILHTDIGCNAILDKAKWRAEETLL
jgi:replicative DNA helicase